MYLLIIYRNILFFWEITESISFIPCIDDDDDDFK